MDSKTKKILTGVDKHKHAHEYERHVVEETIDYI